MRKLLGKYMHSIKDHDKGSDVFKELTLLGNAVTNTVTKYTGCWSARSDMFTFTIYSGNLLTCVRDKNPIVIGVDAKTLKALLETSDMVIETTNGVSTSLKVINLITGESGTLKYYKRSDGIIYLRIFNTRTGYIDFPIVCHLDNNSDVLGVDIFDNPSMELGSNVAREYNDKLKLILNKGLL